MTTVYQLSTKSKFKLFVAGEAGQEAIAAVRRIPAAGPTGAGAPKYRRELATFTIPADAVPVEEKAISRALRRALAIE